MRCLFRRRALTGVVACLLYCAVLAVAPYSFAISSGDEASGTESFVITVDAIVDEEVDTETVLAVETVSTTESVYEMEPDAVIVLDDGVVTDEPVAPVAAKPTGTLRISKRVRPLNGPDVRITVTWYDDDGKTVLDGPTDVDWLSGDKAEYHGEVPSKPEDESYTYEFSGWSRSDDAFGNISYMAVYTSVPKGPAPEKVQYMLKYSIMWDIASVVTNVPDPVQLEGYVPGVVAFEVSGQVPVRPGWKFAGWRTEDGMILQPGDTYHVSGVSDDVYDGYYVKFVYAE